MSNLFFIGCENDAVWFNYTCILPPFANPVTQQLNYKEVVIHIILAMFPGFTSQLFSFAKSENKKSALLYCRHMQPTGVQCPGLGAELLISYWAAIHIYSTGVYIALKLYVFGCNLLEFSTLTLGAEPLSVASYCHAASYKLPSKMLKRHWILEKLLTLLHPAVFQQWVQVKATL